MWWAGCSSRPDEARWLLVTERPGRRICDTLVVLIAGAELASGRGSATVLFRASRFRPGGDTVASMSDLHADVAQLGEHHLAKVRVAGSNPVVRSEVPGAVSPVFMTQRGQGPCGSAGTLAGPLERRPVAEWPSGLGKGLQSPVRGFDSRFRLGRLAQRESASLTRKRSLVQSQYRPRIAAGERPVFEHGG